MAKTKLGQYIALSDFKNSDDRFTLDNLKGISIQKCFIETKADMEGVPLKNYLIVEPQQFSYVPTTSRNGEKITLAHNTTNDTYIVSSSYIVFYVKDTEELLPDYLFMYFNRPEFDRYSRFNSWGSAREAFTWEDLCDIEIDLPNIPEQQKVVDVYNAMLANQKAYETGLEDLKLTCDAYIDKIKNKFLMPIKELVELENIVNSNLEIPFNNLRGINEYNQFTKTRDTIKSEDMIKYKIIKQNHFVVNFMCLGNFGKFYLAHNNTKINILISPACQTFRLKNDEILPNYFLLFLTRSEFQRYCVFLGDLNTRGGIGWEEFINIKIPIPKIEIQQAIVNIYNAYIMRKEINEKLKAQIKDTCPILIRGSLKK